MKNINVDFVGFARDNIVIPLKLNYINPKKAYKMGFYFLSNLGINSVTILISQYFHFVYAGITKKFFKRKYQWHYLLN